MIDGRLPSLDRLPRHRGLLERAFARFRDDIRALGLVLGGSLARGGADFYSDVDLYVVVWDGAFEDVFAERNSTAEAVGSPLFNFAVDPVPGGSTDHIVLYEGPVKFDFMYLKESDLGPHPRWDGCAVLKDTNGRVGAAVARSEALGPPRPNAEDLSELNQKFWTWSGTPSARSSGASYGRRWMVCIASAAWPSCPCWTGAPKDATRATGGWRARRTESKPRAWGPRSPRCGPRPSTRRCEPRWNCFGSYERGCSTVTDWASNWRTRRR